MNKITLTINNKEYLFYFGLGFLGRALDELNLSIDELGSKLSNNPFLYAPKLMFYSLEYGYSRDGKDFDISYIDFVELLDSDNSIGNGNVEKYLSAFTSSLNKDVPKSKVKESKKK